MSYKERSIWGSLAITIYIWFNYFSTLYGSAQQEILTTSIMQSALLTVVIMTIVLEIFHHIVIAIIDNKNTNYDDDERDKKIALLGTQNAYYILSFTTIIAVLHLLFPFMSQRLVSLLNFPNEYVIINIIIFGALVAEIVKFATQVFYYRRGF
ncbi:MAG: C4-dicarboxylate transporter [Psychroserpens sp.]|jgi:C4-dicarboxylate transporter